MHKDQTEKGKEKGLIRANCYDYQRNSNELSLAICRTKQSKQIHSEKIPRYSVREVKSVVQKKNPIH